MNFEGKIFFTQNWCNITLDKSAAVLSCGFAVYMINSLFGPVDLPNILALDFFCFFLPTKIKY
jgi:hypothetical protein